MDRRSKSLGDTLGAATLAAVLACASVGTARADEPSKNLILATTTSTQDSGLLDVLVPIFEKQSGYRVKTIAVGTGEALAMGGRGDADVLLAHAPALEKRYVAEGSMINRRMIMHNDFIVVGPEGDPAGLKGLTDAADALRRIASAKATFVSRGDNSGTHFREKKLWEGAGIQPSGDWYLESGQGMGATLVIASEKRAYTLCDRGTFLAMRKGLEIEALVEGDRVLLNLYSVMEVNPERFSKVNHAAAVAFGDFLVTPETQAIIETFGVEKFGQPLFFPDAAKMVQAPAD
ncbi:MAG: substrate-binding domain-containing protein [Myxococcota bacterium]